ncbi:MAG: hypothetical protein KC996_10220 [Phycisphaerales bacterium]|nr:hypothetical protein [Phycisphaerales bacterium]
MPRHLFVPLLAGLAVLPACSLRPTYQVRVVNDSNATVVAVVRRDRTLAEDETLAQARIKPGRTEVLGPVTADPLDPVDLLVARPEDLQSLPDAHRLSRGSWTATITDAPITTWHRFDVELKRD